MFIQEINYIFMIILEKRAISNLLDLPSVIPFGRVSFASLPWANGKRIDVAFLQSLLPYQIMK